MEPMTKEEGKRQIHNLDRWLGRFRQEPRLYSLIINELELEKVKIERRIAPSLRKGATA